MMWLLLSLVAICLIVIVGNRPHRELVMEQSDDQQENLLPPAFVNIEAEDEYLIPVITAAIHEFTDTENFEVVRIKPNARNWILIGRQNQLANGK
jgi:Na+-transporting methylmalonyl-CoA/oxaloacetate decarboxylase gamma subunit